MPSISSITRDRLRMALSNPSAAAEIADTLDYLVESGFFGDADGIRLNNVVFREQGDAVEKTTTTTLTIANLLAGIITGTHSVGSTQTYTLPTLVNITAGIPDDIANAGFEWSLINLSAAAADTITVAANTGHDVVGNMVVRSAHSSSTSPNVGRFFTVIGATAPIVTYRIG